MIEDYIIVGGGLAGMLVAWELYERGASFIMIADDGPASSNVAAGTWNPVTFRRMIPTWRAQEMIDAMLAVYPKVEKAVGMDLLSMIEVEKILANEQETNFWVEKAKTEESKDFLESSLITINVKGESKTAGIVKQTGRLDLPNYVAKLQAFFLEKGFLIKESFEHDLLKINENDVSYKELKAQKVIFCEGTYCETNPFFNWLPFKSVKGDVLTIKSENLKVSRIRKKNVFILPLGDDMYKVGATYDWADKTNAATEKGKQELLEKLNDLINCECEIIEHFAGVRPPHS